MADPIFALDRRTNRRYRLNLPIHYRVSQKDCAPLEGTGTTLDMSSTGLSFRSRKPLPVDAHVELFIDWPARPNDVRPVELQVTGFILHSDQGKFGVKVNSHKFLVNAKPAVAIPATA